MLKMDSQMINFAPKKIKVENAVGTTLAHDITEVRPGEYKGPSFRKGHTVQENDLCHLMRLGKRHLYIIDLDKNQVHEDDAVFELAGALSGPGVTFSGTPKEGKLQLKAVYDGLLKVKVEPLVAFNMIKEVMCASIHNNTPVRKGDDIAGTRAIPLVIQRPILNQAVEHANAHHPIFTVKAFKSAKARLVITGNEVYDGLIEDKFEKVVRKKLEKMGSKLVETIILPDDRNKIAAQVKTYLASDTDLIITTGGMSVDPDDVTRLGIRDAGVDEFHYSAGVLPGAMFQLAYKGNIPIIGIPACALYYNATVFDLVLPRLLAGEKPDNRDLARLSHGGLCTNCPTCRFPKCSFGKP